MLWGSRGGFPTPAPATLLPQVFLSSILVPSFLCLWMFVAVRQQAWCRCTCSWSATPRRRCTDPTRASTSLASATAQTTLVSSCTRTPGPAAAAAPPPSPQRRLCRWTPPPTRLCSSVQSTNKCRPRPAEECFRSDWILAWNMRSLCCSPTSWPPLFKRPDC